MTKLKLLSAALIAAAMLAIPAMARESHVTSRHVAETPYAAAPTLASGRRAWVHLPRSRGLTRPANPPRTFDLSA